MIVSPFNEAIARDEARAAQGRELLAREKAALRDAPQLPALLAELRTRADGEAARVFGVTDTVAATAALAGWVRNAATGAGLRGAQTIAAPVQLVAGDVRAVGVDLRADGDFSAVANWLDLMASGERALVVERLDLSAGLDATGSVSLGARVRGFIAPFAVPRTAVRGRRP